MVQKLDAARLTDAVHANPDILKQVAQRLFGIPGGFLRARYPTGKWATLPHHEVCKQDPDITLGHERMSYSVSRPKGIVLAADISFRSLMPFRIRMVIVFVRNRQYIISI